MNNSTIKAMSFNILWKDIEATAANDPTVQIKNPVSNRMLQINEILKGEKIDVAGLQEVSYKWRPHLVNLDSDYAYVGALTTDTQEGGYILYNKNRLELLEDGMFWLAQGAPTEYAKPEGADFDRICAWAIFRVRATGGVFVFMDTHVDYVGGKVHIEETTALHEQTAVLKRLASEKYGAEDNCPLVLVGDMNMLDNSEGYKILTQNLRNARECSIGKTIPATHSSFRAYYYCKSMDDVPQDSAVIDFIFVSDSITVNNFDMLYTTTNLCKYGEYISDHNVITADISF